jgi:hypothetical protein
MYLRPTAPLIIGAGCGVMKNTDAIWRRFNQRVVHPYAAHNALDVRAVLLWLRIPVQNSHPFQLKPYHLFQLKPGHCSDSNPSCCVFQCYQQIYSAT